MKCQNWNHIAWECTEQTDTCGTCGENDHWMKNCTNKEKKHCVSCKTDDHASWSRTCLIFLKKYDELDKRTPENNLPFFPASEPWTWLSTTRPASHPLHMEPPPIHTRGRNQHDRIQMQKDTAPNGCPYEKRSGNRPEPPHINNSNSPTRPLPTCSTPPPSFFELPDQTNTNEPIEPQVTNTQDDIYA